MPHDAHPTLHHAPTPPASHLGPFPGGWERHRDAHCVWIVTPEGYEHVHAFDEVALALSAAFHDLGGSAPVVTSVADWDGRAPIVYGAHLLPADAPDWLPPGSVLVNLEQVGADSAWFTPRYRSNLARLPVLDYSARNRDALADLAAPHAGVLEVGYAPALTRIPRAAEQDIDVLFYGGLNERRLAALRAVQATGLNLVALYGAYGQVRDEHVARSKVVLNLHAYEAKVFEVVRVSFLLANGVCVLTEGEPDDPDLQPYRDGLALTGYDDVVERCLALVADADERERLSAAGLAAMRARPQTELLLRAMEG